MPYRDELLAMRERVVELEREVGARDAELRVLRERLRQAEVRLGLRRAGRALAVGGFGTFAGLGVMVPIATVAGSGAGLVAFGGIVGGLFGLLIGLGSEITPR